MKYEACFNNIKESIILVSNGKIEYVNLSFLMQFKSQIQSLQYEEIEIGQPKLSFIDKFRSLFKNIEILRD